MTYNLKYSSNFAFVEKEIPSGRESKGWEKVLPEDHAMIATPPAVPLASIFGKCSFSANSTTNSARSIALSLKNYACCLGSALWIKPMSSFVKGFEPG